jgi:hypothetical protein
MVELGDDRRDRAINVSKIHKPSRVGINAAFAHHRHGVRVAVHSTAGVPDWYLGQNVGCLETKIDLQCYARARHASIYLG